ncbi:MAG: carbohydrate kinase family protein [Chloroflexota bacterium]
MIAHGIVGRLMQDFILTADGRSHANLLGGSAAYAAVGARLWSDSVAVYARIGGNYPETLLAQLARTGIRLDGMRRLESSLDHRRFLAYPSLSERSETHPAAHYLRTGNPFPKELIDYTPLSDRLGAVDASSPQGYRPEDLPPSDPVPAAMHLCPGDYPTHLLLPVKLRERGTRMITLDPAPHTIDREEWDSLRRMVRGLDAFLPSEEEARHFFQSSSPDVWEMAEAFAEMGCRFVILKRGHGGQCVWDRDSRRRWHVPAYPARVRDVTGAGDAFAGGLLVGLATTGDVLEATLRGNVSASIVVEGSGPLYALDAVPGLVGARLEALRALVRPF